MLLLDNAVFTTNLAVSFALRRKPQVRERLARVKQWISSENFSIETSGSNERHEHPCASLISAETADILRRYPQLRERMARIDHWISSKGNKHFDFTTETFGSMKDMSPHVPAVNHA